MKLWSLRKIQVHLFYAARRAQETSPWLSPPDATGIATVSLVQTDLALTVLCAASIVAHKPVSQPFVVMFSFGAFVFLAVLNYFTLIFRGQWRHFAHEFHAYTDEDLGLVSAGVFLGSLAWWGLMMFWAANATKFGP